MFNSLKYLYLLNKFNNYFFYKLNMLKFYNTYDLMFFVKKKINIQYFVKEKNLKFVKLKFRKYNIYRCICTTITLILFYIII